MSFLESDSSGILSQLILIGVLTLINAFFASAEMAFVSVNKNKIKKLSEEGNKRAILLERLINEPSNFLSTIQVGITLAGFFSSASAATGIADDVAKILSDLGIPYTQQISMIGVTILLSYFTLVFGELVPKRLALKKAEHIALYSAQVIYLVSIIAKPFIYILSISTGIILKLTGNTQSDIEEKMSEEEIRSIICQSQRDGCIAYEEQEMIEGVFEFNDKTVKEIMTPRKDTFMIDIETPTMEILDHILEKNYSRIPIYQDTTDNIIGVLYIKDILKIARTVGFQNINVKDIMHEPFFVPESKKNNQLFNDLKAQKVHMALLIDEYGGLSGIVTMEDLIEEILGDISDEYDKDISEIRQVSPNTYLVKGSVPIHRINNKLHLNIEPGEYDTLNGYLITKLGKIPKQNTHIKLKTNSAEFKAIKVSNTHIEEVEIKFQ